MHLQFPLVRADQLLERGLVPGPGPVDQLVLTVPPSHPCLPLRTCLR